MTLEVVLSYFSGGSGSDDWQQVDGSYVCTDRYIYIYIIYLGFWLITKYMSEFGSTNFKHDD